MTIIASSLWILFHASTAFSGSITKGANKSATLCVQVAEMTKVPATFCLEVCFNTAVFTEPAVLAEYLGPKIEFTVTLAEAATASAWAVLPSSSLSFLRN